MTSASFPTVVYVAGSGRSGSTLVERILGSLPGWVNIGELIDLFRRVYAGDERCGCGQPFSECPFWQGVGERAFGGWTSSVVEECAELQAKVARQRHIPQLLSPLQRPSFSRDRDRYADLHASLYSAIAEQAGARFVVDASKWPAQALALATGRIDLRVMHVKREAAGVVYSLSKKDVVRPQATGEVEHMYSQGVVASAAAWATCQAEVELLRIPRLPIGRVSYESLVTDARSEIAQALRAIGLELPDEGTDHLRADTVELTASHGLSGNPGRFIAGSTTLRKDDAWRSKLTRGQRLVATTFSLPDRLLSSGRRTDGTTPR